MNNFNTVVGNAEISELSKLIATVVEKDSKVVITFGAKKGEDKIFNMVKVVNPKSTLVSKVSSTIPNDYEGEKPVTVAMSAAVFTGNVDALLSYKSDIEFEISDGELYVSVKGKARLNCPVLSEIPSEVKPSDILIKYTLDNAKNKKLLKMGLSCTAAQADARGISNACIKLNTATGEAVGFSTDAILSQSTTVKGTVQGDDTEQGKAMKEALLAYCAKSGQKADDFVIILPHDEVVRLTALTGGVAKVMYLVDETHVSVAVSSTVAYTFTQGAKAPMDINLIKERINSLDKVTFQFDNEELSTAVDVHNKTMSIVDPSGTKPLRFACNGKKFVVSAANGVNATAIGVKTDATEFAGGISGRVLSKALQLIDKGNLVASVVGQTMLMITPGTLDKSDDSSMILIMLVAIKDDADSDEEKAEEVETKE